MVFLPCSVDFGLSISLPRHLRLARFPVPVPGMARRIPASDNRCTAPALIRGSQRDGARGRARATVVAACLAQRRRGVRPSRGAAGSADVGHLRPAQQARMRPIADVGPRTPRDPRRRSCRGRSIPACTRMLSGVDRDGSVDPNEPGRACRPEARAGGSRSVSRMRSPGCQRSAAGLSRRLPLSSLGMTRSSRLGAVPEPYTKVRQTTQSGLFSLSDLGEALINAAMRSFVA